MCCNLHINHAEDNIGPYYEIQPKRTLVGYQLKSSRRMVDETKALLSECYWALCGMVKSDSILVLVTQSTLQMTI